MFDPRCREEGQKEAAGSGIVVGVCGDAAMWKMNRAKEGDAMLNTLV